MAKLTKEQLKQHVQEICNFPLYVSSLKYSEKIQIFKYITETRQKGFEYCEALIDSNPEYNYPEECMTRGHKFRYWVEHYSTKEINHCDIAQEYIVNSVTKHKKFTREIHCKELEDHYGAMAKLNREALADEQNKGIHPTLIQALSIPTKGKPDDIMNFWLKLTGLNEKGYFYWSDELEIKHFVNQNFRLFPGVTELKKFNPNMTKDDLYHVAQCCYDVFGMHNTKGQYVELLKENFVTFKGVNVLYSNIVSKNKKYPLNELYPCKTTKRAQSAEITAKAQKLKKSQNRSANNDKNSQ